MRGLGDQRSVERLELYEVRVVQYGGPCQGTVGKFDRSMLPCCIYGVATIPLLLTRMRCLVPQPPLVEDITLAPALEVRISYNTQKYNLEPGQNDKRAIRYCLPHRSLSAFHVTSLVHLVQNMSLNKDARFCSTRQCPLSARTRIIVYRTE